MIKQYYTILSIFLLTILCSTLEVSGNNAELLFKDDINSIEKLDLLKSLSDERRQQGSPASIKYELMGLQLAQELENKRYQADFHIRLGASYTIRGDYEMALTELLTSLKLYEELTFPKGIHASKIHMVSLYLHMKDYRKAGELVDHLVATNRSGNQSLALIESLSMKAHVSVHMNDYSTAVASQKEAIRISKTKNNPAILSELYCQLGGFYIEMLQYDSGMVYLQKSIAIKEQFIEKEPLICTNMRFLEYHRGQKHHEKVTEYAFKILEISEELNLLPFQVKINELLANNYAESGMYQAAYEHRSKAGMLSDSLLNIRKQQEIASLESLYELDKKDARIRSEKKQKLLATTGVVLAILLIIMLINRLLTQKKLNLLKQQQLEESIALKNRELVNVSLYKTEKNSILRDISDRLHHVKKKDSPTRSDLKKIERLVTGNMDRATEWDVLNRHFQEVSPEFFDTLKNRQPALTQNELKHSAYLKMSLSNKEIARLLGINHSSVHMAQYRLKKRLNLNKSDSLVSFIHSI